MSSFALSRLFIYPVKSLGGIALDTWPVVKTGLKYDRKWMLIDKDRQFLSQRRLPKMALIHTAITLEDLVISAPSMTDMTIPLATEEQDTILSTIWHDQVNTRRVSSEADQWFSDFLNINCQLVGLPDKVIRHVNPEYAQPDDQVALSDGFPFLIVSENSLHQLNQVMGLSLAMERFRPNLVISGCEAYAEDSWREISVGSIDFRLPKPCSRCAVPTIDPVTGETGKEPLTTLNRLRKWQNKVYFGQNAIHDCLGPITIGDKVNINKTGQPQPPLAGQSI
jgi:uncharacterized protein YcbX